MTEGRELPRTVPFADAGCAGAGEHRPRPVVSQLHHVFPVFLQARAWEGVDPDRPGTAKDRERVPLCGTCHDTVHALIAAATGNGKAPPSAPRKLAALAAEAVARYRKALGK